MRLISNPASQRRGHPYPTLFMADETNKPAIPGDDAAPKKVLDLLDGPKPTRGQRRKQQLAEEVVVKLSPLEDAKKNALSLFDDEEKPKKKAVRRKDASAGLVPIAPVREDAGHVSAPDKLAQALKAGSSYAGGHRQESWHPVQGQPAGGGGCRGGYGYGNAGGRRGRASGRKRPRRQPPLNVAIGEAGGKTVSIKQALTVKDLAEKIDLRPFQVIKHLMDMEVFANASTLVEPRPGGENLRDARICGGARAAGKRRWRA